MNTENYFSYSYLKHDLKLLSNWEEMLHPPWWPSFRRVSHVSRIVSATKQQSINTDSTSHYGITM
jgi:hypothetical protein